MATIGTITYHSKARRLAGKLKADVHAKKYDGADGHGIWIDMCLDHSGFRQEAERWVTFMAKLLNPHPATIGYILWNEPNLSADIDIIRIPSPRFMAGWSGDTRQ